MESDNRSTTLKFVVVWQAVRFYLVHNTAHGFKAEHGAERFKAQILLIRFAFADQSVLCSLLPSSHQL